MVVKSTRFPVSLSFYACLRSASRGSRAVKGSYLGTRTGRRAQGKQTNSRADVAFQSELLQESYPPPVAVALHPGAPPGSVFTEEEKPETISSRRQSETWILSLVERRNTRMYTTWPTL